MPVVACGDVVSASGPPLVTGHPVVQMVFAVSFRDDLGDPAYLAGVGRAGRNTNCPLRSLVREEFKQWCLTA